MVPLWVELSFAMGLFFIGLTGMLLRRNLLVLLMCIELMLNSAHLSWVLFAHHLQDVSGQIFVLFGIALAAAESAVGLSLVIAAFRTLRTVETDALEMLKE